VQSKPAPPKVQAWTCTVCGLQWATTVVNPAMSIVGLLPTPQLRTAALPATLRTEVTHHSGKEHTMTVAVFLPVTAVISIEAMASVNTVVWRCRICDHHGTTTTRHTAHSDGIEHLTTEHHATIGITY
jgi:ribosomal protein L37AE/L43A